MKGKILGLLSLSILSLVLFVGIVSASVSFTSKINDVSTVLQGNSVVVSFKLQENGDGDLVNMSFNTPIVMTSGLNSFNSANSVSGAITSLTNSSTSAVMTLTLTVPANQATGVYTGNLQVNGDYGAGDVLLGTLPITITVNENPLSCTIGNPGNLKINNIDFNNRGISDTEFGDDDAWFPLDTIEVEIEVENNGNDDVDNIEVEWGLYNTKTNEWVIELEDEKDFDLKDGKDETLNIEFILNEKRLDVDFNDLSDGKNYKFYVQATGEVDNVNNDDTCASGTEDIEIVIESDFVVLDDIDFPEIVSCGESFQVLAEVWNIGDDDQNDVLVYIENSELGINKKVEVGDIDAFENEDLDTTLTIPADAKEKTHNLVFQVYDEDNDQYQSDFDDDDSEFVFPLTVSGCSGSSTGETTTPGVLVSASLSSGGNAGEELVIKATVTNLGDSTATYTLNPAGYSEWASSASLSKSVLILTSGNSEEITITMDVKDDVSGEKTFNLEVISDNKLVKSQPISVTIKEKAGGFSFLTGNVISKDNWYLWGIGALNIILVVIIIVVVVRLARR